MRQINLNVTPEFERDLRLFMKARGIGTKSDAVRQAVREAAERAKPAKYDFSKWLGMANKFAANKNPQFKSEDDLW